LVNKKKKQICSHLLTAYQGGQKDRNGKMMQFFFTMFFTSENGDGMNIMDHFAKQGHDLLLDKSKLSRHVEEKWSLLLDSYQLD
jgi:hypothetical protein